MCSKQGKQDGRDNKLAYVCVGVCRCMGKKMGKDLIAIEFKCAEVLASSRLFDLHDGAGKRTRNKPVGGGAKHREEALAIFQQQSDLMTCEKTN